MSDHQKIKLERFKALKVSYVDDISIWYLSRAIWTERRSNFVGRGCSGPFERLPENSIEKHDILYQASKKRDGVWNK